VLGYFDQLCQTPDAPVPARSFLAEEYALAGRLDSAVKVLEVAGGSAVAPHWLLEAADRATTEGDYETALELAELADRHPASASPGVAETQTTFALWQTRVTSLGELGRWPEAAEAAKRALELAPTDAQRLQAQVGSVDILLYHLRQPAQARAILEGLPRGVRSTAVWVHWRLADCDFFTGDWDQATERFQALAKPAARPPVFPPAAEEEADSGAVVPLFPQAYTRPGRTDFEPPPGPDYAYFRLAEISLRRGDFAGAGMLLATFAAQFPESRYCTEALRWCELLALDFALDPASAKQYLAALVALDAGRTEEGEAKLQALVAQGPSQLLGDDAELALGRKREERGDLAGAVAAYRALVTQFPSSALVPRALLNEGRLLWRKLGRQDEGRDRLNQIVRDRPGSALAETAQAELDALASATQRRQMRKASR
jgi:tetratricopeptide (TPR) repeat protein